MNNDSLDVSLVPLHAAVKLACGMDHNSQASSFGRNLLRIVGIGSGPLQSVEL